MSSPFSATFANPSRVLTFAGDLLSPVKGLRHLIWPFAVFALIAGYFNWYELKENLDLALSTFSFVQNLVISMLTANLLSRLVMGMTMAYLGIAPPEFGIRLFFGVIPRFFVSTGQIRRLDYPEQRICYAAPLLARLALFVFGTLFWVLTRRGGTGAADAALVLGSTGLGAFLFTLNPMWRADGYHWMAAWFRMPDLREQSYRLLGLILRGKPIPEMLSARAIRGLLFYAVLSIGFTTALVLLVFSAVAFALEEQFRGTGVVMFAAILSMSLAWLINRRSRGKDKPTQKNPRRTVEASHRSSVSCYKAPNVIVGEAEPKGSEQMAHQKAGKHEPRQRSKSTDKSDVLNSELDAILGDGSAEPLQPPESSAVDAGLEDILGPVALNLKPRDEFDEILDAALSTQPVSKSEASSAPEATPETASRTKREAQPSDHLDTVLKLDKARRTKSSRVRRLAIWVLILSVLYFVAIQPYSFTVGGDFFVRPLERTQVRARTNGEIIQINVNEGDWVSENQVLALLSSWEEKSDVEIAKADLVRLEANLETLIADPKPEEIELAKQVLQAAQFREKLAEGEKARKESLAEIGASTQKSLEEAETAYSLAVNLREQAEARLNLLQSPVSESEIEAARANILRKQEELALSVLRLGHTEIRAPAAGQVVSTMQKISVGAFLREGDLLAELADSRIVLAEIEVPETEIDEAVIGAEVMMKLWRTPDEVIMGTVKRVAPVAEEREFGYVVRVIVEVPNPDGRINRNLTGYGKIIVEDRPVWEVFSRVFIRFFKIEIWSWLP